MLKESSTKLQLKARYFNKTLSQTLRTRRIKIITKKTRMKKKFKMKKKKLKKRKLK